MAYCTVEYAMAVIMNLPYMHTNADTLTNKMPELKALHVEYHNPWIIAVTEIIPKNYQISLQKAELKISNNYDIFPECVLSKGRGIKIQTHKDLNDHDIKLAAKYPTNYLTNEMDYQ